MLALTKVAKIKKRFPLLEFIESQGIQLKKNGTSYIGKCPFHDDDTPSLSVSPDKGLWNCFGCDKGGDVISFYQYLKGIDNKQAIAELSKLDEVKPLPVKTTELPLVPKKINLNDIAKLYHSSLMVNRDAQNYLKERGLTELEIYKKYQLGYCDGRKLSSIVQQSEQQKQQLYELGLPLVNPRSLTDESNKV